VPALTAMPARWGLWAPWRSAWARRMAQGGAAGALDPDSGVQGLASRFGVGGTFTCCDDTTLNGLINQSITTVNMVKRQAIFDEIYKYISDKQLTVELHTLPVPMIASKSVEGLAPAPYSLAIVEMLNWENVGVK
jgi:ABC-type transport system substrate-binding protein